MNYIKTIGVIAVLGFFIVGANAVKTNIYALVGVISIETILSLLALTWLVTFLSRHILTNVYNIKHTHLDYSIKSNIHSIDMKERLENLRLASFRNFDGKHALAHLDHDNFSMLHVPTSVQATRIQEVTEPVKLISSPMPSGLSLITSGQVGRTDEVNLGVDDEGKLFNRRLKNVLVLGRSGQGKSRTVLWLVMQQLLLGSKLAVIDPHLGNEESLGTLLEPFQERYITPVAGFNPTACMRVVGYVKNVLERRITGDDKSTYRVALVVDELTSILAHSQEKDSEWKECALALASLIESINTQGRKYKVMVICGAQAPNANRLGSTTTREQFSTFIYHNLREQNAKLVSMSEMKHEIKHLAVGQVIIDHDGEDYVTLRVPFLDDDAVDEVVERGLLPSQETVQSGFKVGSDRVQSEIEAPLNPPVERVHMVQQLKSEGRTKLQIIEEVYGAKKGATKAYKNACLEYDTIIEGNRLT